MDSLEMMLSFQEALQQRMGYDFAKMSNTEKAAYIKEYTLFATDELHEMLHELPHFKPWRKYSDDPALVTMANEKACEEFIDAIHFILNIALALGLSADDIVKAYCKKNAINHQRQDNASEYKPCVDRTE